MAGKLGAGEGLAHEGGGRKGSWALAAGALLEEGRGEQAARVLPGPWHVPDLDRAHVLGQS